MTAAMKKVLSPISDTSIMPDDFRKPAAKPPESKLVMLARAYAGGMRAVDELAAPEWAADKR